MTAPFSGILKPRSANEGLACEHPFAITPNDGADLESPTWGGFSIGADPGTVVVRRASDEAEVAIPLPAFGYCPVVATRVMATGTTGGLVIIGYGKPAAS